MAIVLGAILVVTGPTVILPLLRQARLNKDSASLLKWEGIVNDPVGVLLAVLTFQYLTIGADMRKQDKLLLAWIAPRGIVAAATAGSFGPALVAAGYPDAEKLLPVTFLIIVATVLAHGQSIGRVARRLDLAAKSDNGMLIVGASPWSVALAQALKKLEIEVLLGDGVHGRLKEARMAGVETYYGEILSEHAEHTLESQHLNYLLCATDNDFYNALVCKAEGRRFGHHRTFQLATHLASGQELKGLTLQKRGYFAFDPAPSYESLDQLLAEGWTVQTTTLTCQAWLGRVQGTHGSDRH